MQAAALLLAACATYEPRTTLSTTRLAAELDRLERRGMIGQVLVARHDEVLLLRAIGDRPDGRLTSDEDIFPLASLTKPFTAAAILALAEDGRLALDDPLGRHLTGLAPPWSDIPLHALLTHTAGLPAEIINRAWPGDPQFEPVDRDTFLQRVQQFPPDHPPGAGYNYSNVGYGLLGAVVERHAGVAWDHYLQQRLLDAAGITGIAPPHRQPADRLAPGRRDGVSWGTYADQPALTDGLGWHLRASGDLHAPPRAVLAWWRAMRRGPWLNPDSQAAATRPRARESATVEYALGWQVRDTPHGPVIGHPGGNRVFAVDFSWFTEYDVLVYIASADSRFEADVIRDRLHARLFGP